MRVAAALARIIESNFHIVLPRCLAFITARLLCWVQFCGIVMCEPQPEQWKNDAVCASCVCVGLLPGCGAIWSGVRICDKLQIYLGGAHCSIPLPLRQNAQCWLGCQMLAWVAGSGKIKTRSPKSPAKKIFVSCLICCYDGPAWLKAPSRTCGADDTAETAFCFVPAAIETWTALHLAPLNKMKLLTG